MSIPRPEKSTSDDCPSRLELTRLSSHGTFRPSLKGLVQQNGEDFVKETTTIGFSEPSLSDSLNVITKLKGIGPATAALLLSTSDPEKLPFFSDELFRWAFWEDKAGARWDRKIKYSLKEYRELVARVDELRKRIGRTALEAEKVAYVLGKQGVSLSGAEEATKASKAAEPTKESTQAKRKAAVVRDTEQKADENPPAKSQKSQAFLGPRRVTRSSKRRE